ncbi:anti-sigma factor [Oryzifoliimicrobium ureilyticus]|uniref:anti-sigma factor n=1 Tax=Oryzifoliimicrobium ureilyticus TaxID=3113724 RepID=UPI00307621CC
MTTPDRSKGDRSRDEVLAGEYVLGVLSFKDRRVVEERMRRDRQFAAIVGRWEANLSSMNEEYSHAYPSKEAFRRIETRLFSDAMSSSIRGGLWGSIIFWRALAFASLSVALGALLFTVTPGVRSTVRMPMVADLSSTQSGVSLRASYDDRNGLIRIVPVASGRPEEKSLELWLVPSDGKPKSLGVFQSGKNGELIVPNELRQSISEGATLAISLEPFGGSPTGQPTGPVIASGATKKL